MAEMGYVFSTILKREKKIYVLYNANFLLEF